MQTRTKDEPEVSVQQFLDDIKVLVQDGQELLKVRTGDLKQKAIAGARSTDKVVRAHPYQTIGIAFGVGLIVGALACNFMTRGSNDGMAEFE